MRRFLPRGIDLRRRKVKTVYLYHVTPLARVQSPLLSSAGDVVPDSVPRAMVGQAVWSCRREEV